MSSQTPPESASHPAGTPASVPQSESPQDSASPSSPASTGAEGTPDPLPLALTLAEKLLKQALASETTAERRQAARMARMVEDAPGKRFTIRLADEIFRSRDPHVQADRLRHLASVTGLPAWMTPLERALLKTGLWGSALAPALAMPAVEAKLRADSAGVILPGEPDKLHRYIAGRRAAGTRVNVNQLGEAILGEEEAGKRLDAILGHLKSPEVNYISVKISAIFSQIHLTAWRETLEAVKERLRLLYRTAMAHPAPDANGVPRAKFVNLDMEEYRDLRLTMTAFQEVLDEPEFQTLHAGIVLQAYLPDSWPLLQELTAWAKRRKNERGGRIKVRLVKGANLAMERVEAELHGWEAAPYGSKHEVDANYKRMLEFALRPENADAVQVGAATHNLFDAALALTLARLNGTESALEMEMLEGMANHQARAVQEEAGGLLVYAPVVKRQDFLSAMAYLVRRLDENTAPENFLRDLFGIRPGSPAWKRQEERFVAAWNARHHVFAGPRRDQDRTRETLATHEARNAGPFVNEPDTDFALPANRAWADAIRERWRDRKPDDVPLGIGEEFVFTATTATVSDPSRPGDTVCRHALAGPAEVDRALARASEFLAEWSGRSPAERAAVLRQCAAVIASRRGELIGCMMREAGKAITEADVEVSEAVDFARYYAGAFESAEAWLKGVKHAPLGVVVVTPPWNFPFAIPCGGVLAALMAGNTVILKPAPEAVLTGWHLVQCLWDAGVPRRALQFLPCPDDETGRSLLTDARAAGVILTGAWETAKLFQSWKADMRLFAETSGKNALIVTARADRDLAIKDLVRSAFGHAGQKCSAASLAILEAEVYDDPAFRRQLRDAAASLRCGGAWDPAAVVTPVIRPPGEALRRALTTLDEGEEWLLKPENLQGNPNLWSPGIRLGVKPGSWYHRTECFGPVLGLMRADSLEHAIALQNDSNFGLTAGIHTLDEREIALWRERVESGNAYINRPITGAIVSRQPFGGWKRSSVGPGVKAGGPNYVFSLCRWTEEAAPSPSAPDLSETLERESSLPPGAARLIDALLKSAGTPEERAAASTAAEHYVRAWREVFSVDSDPVGLSCESNVLRYRRTNGVLLRLESGDSAARSFTVLLAALASAVCGVPLYISSDSALDLPDALAADVKPVVESSAALAARLPELAAKRLVDTLRTISPCAPDILHAAFDAGCRWIDAPLLPNGRLELVRWLREQSVTETRHRYGNPIV